MFHLTSQQVLLVHSYQKAKSLVNAIFISIDVAHGKHYITTVQNILDYNRSCFYTKHNCFLIFLQKNVQEKGCR